MKICKNCNKEYPDSSAFCTGCGGSLSKIEPVTESPKAAPAVQPASAPVTVSSDADVLKEYTTVSTGQSILLCCAIALIISVFVPFYKTNSSFAGMVASLFDDKVSLIDILKTESDSISGSFYAKTGTIYLLIPAFFSVCSGFGAMSHIGKKGVAGIRSIILGVIQLKLLDWYYEKMNIFKGTKLSEFADVSFSDFMDKAAGYQCYLWASIGLVIGGIICLGEAYFENKKGVNR